MTSLGLPSVDHESSPLATSTTAIATASARMEPSLGLSATLRLTESPTSTSASASTTSKVTSPPANSPIWNKWLYDFQAHQAHRLCLHWGQMSILRPGCRAVALGLVPEHVEDVAVGWRR
jgi:hypothetical protein